MLWEATAVPKGTRLERIVEGKIMKVAITAEGKELESPVDSRFGRAKFFIVVDTTTEQFEAVDNKQNVNAPQGAGIQAAQIVTEHGAEAVLTGHCGPKAFRALSASDIKVYVGVTGTVAEALESFKAGTLTEAKAADVEGHWI